MTNRDIQAKVTGMVQKTAWSILWQKKNVLISDLTKKGYKENTVRIAFKKFVDEGWAVKPEGTRNYIEIAEGITNG